MPTKPSTKSPKKSPAKRKSKVYTISLPPDLAARAEAIAKSESRSMSELFRDAFRAYQAEQTRKWLDDLRAYAATRNPHGYTEKDIPRLIKEVRAEMRAEQAAKVRRAG
jgi:CopG family transcriptional regulator/antitoxin EndoAI